MAGIPIIASFDLKAGLPLDSRSIVATLADRDAIAHRYEGMTVFVTSEKKAYLLLGGTSNSDWTSADQYGPDISPPQLARYTMVSTPGEEVYAYSSSTVYGNLVWTRTGTILTMRRAGHALAVGDRVIVRNVNAPVVVALVERVDEDTFDVAVPDSGPIVGWRGAYGIGFNYAHDIPGSQKTGGTLSRPDPEAGELYMHTLSIRPGAGRQDTVYTVHLPSEDMNSDLISGTAGSPSNFISPNFLVRRVDGGIAPYVVVTVVNGVTYSIGGSDENLRINIYF